MASLYLRQCPFRPATQEASVYLKLRLEGHTHEQAAHYALCVKWL